MTLTANQMTLFPVGDPGPYPLADTGDDRRVLTFMARPPLTDEWSFAVLRNGDTVEVRRADCGARCRCAGQYRILTSRPAPAQDVTVRYALVTTEYPANTDPDLVRELEYAASHVFDRVVEVHPGDVVAAEHAPDVVTGEDARGPLMSVRLPEDLDGDSLVVLPDGMDVPGAQHDDGVSAVALIDLARYIVTEYGDTDETTPANFSALLSDYDAWRDERADLSATEEHGGPGGDAWADSDDTGCDLASRLADALRTTTGVAASLRAALNVALNSPDDSDAMEGARAALDGLTASDLAATADARYAALLARVTPAPVVTTANEDRPTYGDCVPGDPIARAVEAFSGEPVALMLAVADRHGIAVHWQERATMEAHHGEPFTDDEWARVGEHMDGYDEWLENSGARESIAYWQDTVLEHAGLTTDDDTERTVYTCRTCGRTVTLITDEDGTYWMHDDDELIMCDSTAWKGSPPPGALTAPHQSQVTT